jgi:hypothetical protein
VAVAAAVRALLARGRPDAAHVHRRAGQGESHSPFPPFARTLTGGSCVRIVPRRARQNATCGREGSNLQKTLAELQLDDGACISVTDKSLPSTANIEIQLTHTL